MKRTVRQYLLVFHLYCGLILGGLFTLLGITGSVLVFYLEIDLLLNPEIQVVKSKQRPVSSEAALNKLRHHFPERIGPWRIEMPMSPDSPITARYYNPVETSGNFFAPLMVTLDPVTLNPTSHRFWGNYAMTWIYDLHFTLLLDEDGRTAVGIIGLIILLLLISGLYLWWPSGKRLIESLKFRLRSGSARRVYDLHVFTGVYSWIVLFMLVVTGSALALPHYTHMFLDNITSFQKQNVYSSPLNVNGKLLNLDKAVDVVKLRYPEAEVRWVQSTGVDNEAIYIRLYQDTEPGRRFPQTKIWLHPQTGEVLQEHNPEKNLPGDTIREWLHPLHNGEVFGLTGRIIVFVFGLVIPVMFITGFIRWRQKVKAAIVKESRNNS